MSVEKDRIGNTDLDKIDMRTIEETEDLKDRGDVVDEGDGKATKSGGKKAPAKKEPARKEPAKKEERDEDEELDEDEEDASEEEATDDEEDEDSGAKSKAVPYKRFRQVNQARRDAEQKLAEVEERLASQKRDDLNNTEKSQAKQLSDRIDNLYVEVEKARATGEYESAAKLQRELDGLKNKISVAQSRFLAREESVRAANENAYDATVTQLETVEPRLDPDHDDFDRSLTQKIEKLTARLEKSGNTPHEALREAAELVLGYNPFKARPEKVEAAKGEKGKGRKEETVRRNAETSRKQPSDTSDNYDDKRTKINVAELTDEEYNALPESKLKQLRGDYL